MSFRGRAEPVLDGASLEVGTGETVAVLGPSGSGKSTLLSVLGGLVRPRAGAAYPADDDGTRRGEPLSDVTSWVLQTTNVLPERTALDNVAVAAQAAGLPRRAALATAHDALTAVGLAGAEHSRTRVMSGGEVQRVAVARALASDRAFILADEPTGQLDHRSTEAVLDALFGAAVAQDGRCGLVVVTHDPLVARRCDRVVRLEDGRVLA